MQLLWAAFAEKKTSLVKLLLVSCEEYSLSSPALFSLSSSCILSVVFKFAGQWRSGCDSQLGPFHQWPQDTSWAAVISLDDKSAELSLLGQYLQHRGSVKLLISLTRFALLVLTRGTLNPAKSSWAICPGDGSLNSVLECLLYLTA